MLGINLFCRQTDKSFIIVTRPDHRSNRQFCFFIFHTLILNEKQCRNWKEPRPKCLDLGYVLVSYQCQYTCRITQWFISNDVVMKSTNMPVILLSALSDATSPCTSQRRTSCRTYPTMTSARFQTDSSAASRIRSHRQL